MTRVSKSKPWYERKSRFLLMRAISEKLSSIGFYTFYVSVFEPHFTRSFQTHSGPNFLRRFRIKSNTLSHCEISLQIIFAAIIPQNQISLLKAAPKFLR